MSYAQVILTCHCFPSITHCLWNSVRNASSAIRLVLRRRSRILCTFLTWISSCRLTLFASSSLQHQRMSPLARSPSCLSPRKMAGSRYSNHGCILVWLHRPRYRALEDWLAYRVHSCTSRQWFYDRLGHQHLGWPSSRIDGDFWLQVSQSFQVTARCPYPST